MLCRVRTYQDNLSVPIIKRALTVQAFYFFATITTTTFSRFIAFRMLPELSTAQCLAVQENEIVSTLKLN